MNISARRILSFGSSLLLFFLASPALAQVGTCGQFDRLSDANRTIATNASRAAGSDFSSFNCRNVSGVSSSDRSRLCVPGLCAGGADIVCCAPGIGGTEGSGRTGSTPSTDTSAPSGDGFIRIQIPEQCLRTGNCSLDDIIRTGVSFANLIFGISGAILLATFVYGGVLYLTAGSSGNVSKAKDMIKNAVIGMILVFGAGLLVSTVYDTFRSDAGGGTDSCASSKPGYSCQYLEASPTDAAAMQSEMERRGCVPNLCAGDESRRCCPDPGAAGR